MATVPPFSELLATTTTSAVHLEMRTPTLQVISGFSIRRLGSCGRMRHFLTGIT